MATITVARARPNGGIAPVVLLAVSSDCGTKRSIGRAVTLENGDTLRSGHSRSLHAAASDMANALLELFGPEQLWLDAEVVHQN